MQRSARDCRGLRWLLDHGARVEVADSPGFGSAEAVARAVGLAQELKTLGLAVRSLNRPVAVRLDTGACFKISRQALDCDLILSVPKVKAHGQMLVTLAVKNLFGCVSGLRKALIHAREGRQPDYFADCLAALWAALPPVAGLADGVCAMHVTGPSRGKPFALRLIGASASAVALDRLSAPYWEQLLTQLRSARLWSDAKPWAAPPRAAASPTLCANRRTLTPGALSCPASLRTPRFNRRACSRVMCAASGRGLPGRVPGVEARASRASGSHAADCP